jgi:hypothetical protein
MINGNSVILQLASEAAYGSVTAMKYQFKAASESLKPAYNKKDEGVATGGRGAGLKATMSKKIEGSFSILGRADDAGFILKHLLGVQADPATVGESSKAFKHTFTALGTALTDSLPSLCAAIDRKAGVFAYSGLKIDSASFSAAAEDYLKIDITVVGRDETAGSLTAALKPSSLRAFRFKHGKVYIAGEAVADVTSIKFDYKNNLDSGTQTTETGDYFAEPQPGTREITTDLEMLYSATAEQIRKNLYKSDNTCALVIDFKSDDMADTDIPYELKMTIPCMQVSDATANMGGLETIKQSLTFGAVDNLSDELVTFELINTQSTAY